MIRTTFYPAVRRKRALESGTLNAHVCMSLGRLARRLGYRYRLHRRDLPGTPDIVLSRPRKVINVHGCFWHLHTCPHGQRAPVKNADYWNRKRRRNADRDRRSARQLRRDGWRVLTIWECQMREPERLAARVARFLSSDPLHA